ncbi:MAG: hypothetical protein HWN67_03800 [Candidatus Helarchaeota archaeon]|nr:hypothetical protein [Candidatus Helarchaeota archaeon]
MLFGSGVRFKRDVLFENTEYEFNIYYVYGTQEGNTMLIIGGMHNEPGGYLTADEYVNIALEKGNLIVVPRANFNTIIHDQRGIKGDMNRKFAQNKKPRDYDEIIVEKIKQLMSESDIVLNLHEGSGFYIETYIDKLRNPMRFGQSIIADSDIYYSSKKNNYIHLEKLAKKVLNSVNKKVINEKYYFRFNNHRTSEKDSPHKEQRLSATYYALTNLEIPAFGIEVSKELPNMEMKIKHISWVINEFMKEFNIIPEYPRVYIDKPVLKFINISINNQVPISLKNNETFYVEPGDEVEITHVETNYKRGITVDIKDYGGIQDLKKKFKVYKNARINVSKDKYNCGSVYMVLRRETKEKTREISLGEDYFLVSVNNRRLVVFPEEEISVVKGDEIKVTDISPSLKRYGDISVNFYGFEPPDKSAEDRGYVINTQRDLLPFYSLDKKGGKYEIRIERREKGFLEIFDKVYVNIIEPKLEFVVLILNEDKKLWFYDGEVLNVSYNDCIKIVGVKTNIPGIDEFGVNVNFYGFVGRRGANDMNMDIRLGNNLLKNYSVSGKGERYEIRVSRIDNIFGKIYVDISPKNITKVDVIEY